jgi:hypothetical protein
VSYLDFPVIGLGSDKAGLGSNLLSIIGISHAYWASDIELWCFHVSTLVKHVNNTQSAIEKIKVSL